jgi:hypothetical protein
MFTPGNIDDGTPPEEKNFLSQIIGKLVGDN